MKNDQIKLNKEQVDAVKYKKGPLLIIAGAGTGKTTTVTERIKHLIGQNLALPEEILALTFTEKAATEMEKRVDVALPYGTFGLWISTFHSFCDRVLRSEALHIGLSSNFKLMSDAETYFFIKKNFWLFDLKYFRPNGNPYKFIEGLIQHFARLKDEDVSSESYLAFAKSQFLLRQAQDPEQSRGTTSKSQKEEIIHPRDGRQKVHGQHLGGEKTKRKTSEVEKEEEAEKYLELANAYKVYEKLKIKEGVMDFSDLISNVLSLFRKRKSILAKYQKQFKYILVDEFQDTNFAQYQLVKLLAPPRSHPNLTVVGDDSQSIYKFRGAAISNILSFMKDYPDAKNVILTTSYRCPQTVLDAAYRLIKHNNPNTLEAQLGISKNLKSNKNHPKGDRPLGEIEIIHSDRVEEEAEKIVYFISFYLKDKNKQYKDFAILVRANNHSAAFIRALDRARIPYQFLGPGMLFQRPEVKELISYLKVLSDFTDSMSLYRVLSMDIWHLEARDILAVLNAAKKLNVSLFEQLENMTEEQVAPLSGDRIWKYKYTKGVNISDDSKTKLKKFVTMVHRHQKLINKETAGQLLYYFLVDSGLLKKVTEYNTQTEERKALNITKFFDKLKSFEATHEDASVFAVVDYLDLAMSLGESPLASEVDWSEVNAVNILTVHSAKGLEFPVVFLTNLVEGRFPSRERKDTLPIPDELIKEFLPTGNYHLQEERRLFYVGMTRTMEKLVLSASNYYGEGKRERRLSPFIRESIGVDDQSHLLMDSQSFQIPLFEWKQKPDDIIQEGEKSSRRLRLDYLSYSAIEAFKICPLHFKLRHILRIPTVPTAALSLGNSVHYALYDFYTMRNSREDEKKLLLKLLDNNWVSYGYTSKIHEERAKESAILFLENYLKSSLHRSSHPIFLEKEFSFRIDPSFKILGKIDRVDDLGQGRIEIIDYKTGPNVPSQKELDANLQMTTYALAAVNPGIFGKKIDQVKLSFYFFGPSVKVSTTRTNEQLNQAVDQLLKIRDTIEQSDFKCSRSIICQNCEYKMLCNE